MARFNEQLGVRPEGERCLLEPTMCALLLSITSEVLIWCMVGMGKQKACGTILIFAWSHGYDMTMGKGVEFLELTQYPFALALQQFQRVITD